MHARFFSLSASGFPAIVQPALLRQISACSCICAWRKSGDSSADSTPTARPMAPDPANHGTQLPQFSAPNSQSSCLPMTNGPFVMRQWTRPRPAGLGDQKRPPPIFHQIPQFPSRLPSPSGGEARNDVVPAGLSCRLRIGFPHASLPAGIRDPVQFGSGRH